ncbi:glycosyltransferase [Schlesneria paludicola]|uniref:glycosyltransferase n=1 Tax=Schlesneria paludicola TaxID=360056 RepID=UPI00030363DD|nr:glycosyltransferase [Schlesneria paludicola]
MRTYNEARYLPALLDSIRQQQVDEGGIEVVLVDSGSTDATLEIAAAAGCRIVHIKKSDFSFGRSLNVGCDASLGEFLVFVSGHCVPRDRDWLMQLTAPLRSGDVAITYGRQLGGGESKFSELQLFEKYFPGELREAPSPFFCNNANAAILKRVWMDFPYDEELPGLEDMDVGRRVVETGMKVSYVPEAAVFHYHHESWKQVKRRYEREAIALQKVIPSVHVSLTDAIRYCAAGVIGDCSKAMAEGTLLKNLGGIVAFRFCQYWGTWRGSNLDRHLTRQMKESYFYPH